MSIFSLAGWFFGMVILIYHLDYFISTRAVAGPYKEAKNSKGKKLLMVVDNGVSGYEFVAAKKEALGYSIKNYGNFRAYEEGIKKFYATSMGLAHVSLEVMIPPAVAVWLQSRGKEVTEEAIDSLPDAFQYLFCDREIERDKKKAVCGWVGPLVPLGVGGELSVTSFIKKLKAEKEDIELCPECGNHDMLKVKTDRSISTIPARAIYNLSDVRAWVQDVANPQNMDMAIERTKINTMRSMQDSFGLVLKWATVMIPMMMVLGIVYVMVASQGGGGMAESVKDTAGGLNL